MGITNMDIMSTNMNTGMSTDTTTWAMTTESSAPAATTPSTRRDW